MQRPEKTPEIMGRKIRAEYLLPSNLDVDFYWFIFYEILS